MPKGMIVMVGLGKPKKGMSMPPKMGPGRPGKDAPGPPHLGAGMETPEEEMMEGPPHAEPDGDEYNAGGVRCPNCGCRLDLIAHERGAEE